MENAQYDFANITVSSVVNELKVRYTKTLEKSMRKSTGLFDDNGTELFVGDFVRSEWNYDLEILEDYHGFYGRLVCEPEHSCATIPYSLCNGRGHGEITKKQTVMKPALRKS